MKEIKLVCEEPFHNSVDVAVMDFPDGLDAHPRKRCQITVEFAQSDVNQLKRQGLDYDEAIVYYQDWLYDTVKMYLADDWKCVGGYDELFELVRQRVSAYYQQ